MRGHSVILLDQCPRKSLAHLTQMSRSLSSLLPRQQRNQLYVQKTQLLVLLWEAVELEAVDQRGPWLHTTEISF